MYVLQELSFESGNELDPWDLRRDNIKEQKI